MGPFAACIVCYSKHQLQIMAAGIPACSACRSELTEASAPLRRQLETWSLLTHWTYSGSMRELILRAKVQSDQRSLRFLRAFAAASRQEVKGALNCDVIIPAPSSLYGRFMGRFDLAACVAADITREIGGTLLPAPYPLYARWRKRSQLAERTSHDAGTRFATTRFGSALDELWARRFKHQLRGRRLLILDDVVTTGHTLLTTARSIATHADVEITFLALASAID